MTRTLHTSFPGLDPNNASAADLAAIKGVGAKRAATIVETREVAPFIDWSDLVDRCAGIGAGTVAKMQNAGCVIVPWFVEFEAEEEPEELATIELKVAPRGEFKLADFAPTHATSLAGLRKESPRGDLLALAIVSLEEQGQVTLDQSQGVDVYQHTDGRLAIFMSGIDNSGAEVWVFAREPEVVEVKTEGLDLCRSEDITDDGIIRLEQMRGAKAWVARITGRCEQYALKREFISRDRASSVDLSSSGRGFIHYRTADLGPGVYEASSTWRSMTPHRTLFEVDSDLEIFIIDSRAEALDLVAEYAAEAPRPTIGDGLMNVAPERLAMLAEAGDVAAEIALARLADRANDLAPLQRYAHRDEASDVRAYAREALKRRGELILIDPKSTTPACEFCDLYIDRDSMRAYIAPHRTETRDVSALTIGRDIDRASLIAWLRTPATQSLLCSFARSGLHRSFSVSGRELEERFAEALDSGTIKQRLGVDAFIDWYSEERRDLAVDLARAYVESDDPKDDLEAIDDVIESVCADAAEQLRGEGIALSFRLDMRFDDILADYIQSVGHWSADAQLVADVIVEAAIMGSNHVEELRRRTMEG